MKRTLLLLAALAALLGCGTGDEDADAYGHFEATEVLISAEGSGRLLAFDVDEGERLRPGVQVGLIDTTQLALKRREVAAQRAAARAKIAGVLAEISVLEEERRAARTELERIRQLVADEAATGQQFDERTARVRVLDERIAAVRIRNEPILGEIAALDAVLAGVDEQLRRSRIVNPVAGTILTTYAEPYELVSPGKPLYTIAALDTMYLRAYVSGAQLPHVHLGQPVEVLIDEDAERLRTLPGEVAWIASEAEFTPQMVQTKEERVTLVYAVKVRVPNPEGTLKIGMPGEVRWRETPAEARPQTATR